MTGEKWESPCGRVVLYCGDCLDVLPTIGKVDAVVTDPPYGVGIDYRSCIDDGELIYRVVIPSIDVCRKIASRVVVTSGNRHAWSYPKPDDFGVWWNPAGTSHGTWGFQCVGTPILYWGADPRTSGGASPSSPVGVGATRECGSIEHPCPKPLSLMRWLIEKASRDGELVADPYMGSGTTGVAAVKLGRRFIGIEKEPAYFEIAKRRIMDALGMEVSVNGVRQRRMFT